jgi:hypothetical protein
MHKLTEIKAALDLSTQGKWYWHNRVLDGDTVIGYDVLQTDDSGVIEWRKTAWLAVNEADAELIANAPDYLRTLLAVAESARALKTAYFEARVGIEDYELQLGELFDALKALD